MPSLDSFPKEGIYLLGFTFRGFTCRRFSLHNPIPLRQRSIAVGGCYRLLNLRAIYATQSDSAMSLGAIHPTLKRVGFLASANPLTFFVKREGGSLIRFHKHTHVLRFTHRVPCHTEFDRKTKRKVIPAKAGTHPTFKGFWIPAFAGMTYSFRCCHQNLSDKVLTTWVKTSADGLETISKP